MQTTIYPVETVGTVRHATTAGEGEKEKAQVSHGISAEPASRLAHMALRQFLLEIVALIYKVDASKLLSPTRGRKNIARARQIAMYLAHTAGGLSLSGVGRLFGRDRTTVAHACALVEDARDEAVFDRTLQSLESAIGCQMELFRSFARYQADQAGEPSLQPTRKAAV